MKSIFPTRCLVFPGFCFCVLLCLLVSSPAQAGEDPSSAFTLNSPVENQVAITRKPEITWKSVIPLSQEPLLVVLDGADISGLVEQHGDSFSFQPIMVLPAGYHSLYISAVDGGGNLVEQEFFFSTRHSEKFEETYSNNELSVIYRGVIGHHVKSEEPPEEPIDDEWFIDDAAIQAEPEVDDFANNSINAYLASDSLVREGNWTTSLSGNLRYFDQDADIFEPEKRGLSLIDVLLSANYSGENLIAEFGLGDNGIQESRNTVDSLYRRGIKGVVQYGNFTLSGFGVLGDEQYNEWNQSGLAFNANDHIMGLSGQFDFFDRQMFLKAIYVNGGETGDSLGTWSATGARKGDVAGFVFFTDFFAGELITEIEYDEASISHDSGEFDAFTTVVYPEFGDESAEIVDESENSDKAYRVNISGMKSIYSYELSYEYTGPRYEVVGNQSLISDRAGYSFIGGAGFEEHSLNLFANSFWDDVENDPLYQRIDSIGAGIEYSYFGWLRFPVSLRYEKGSQRSNDEPPDVDETAIDIDTVEARLGYQDGPWIGDIMTSFSRQDDRTSQDLDNELVTVYLSPGYSGDLLSILPSWSYNSSKDLQSSVCTETHTWTLDLQSLLLAEKVLCELGGTYDRTTTDDNTMDSRIFQGYARVSYRFQALWNLMLPSLGVEYTRNYQKDTIADTLLQEDVITVILSSTLPYSF